MKVVIDQKDFCLKRGFLVSETAADGSSRCAKISVRARKALTQRASYTLMVESLTDSRAASVLSGDLGRVLTLARLSEAPQVEYSFDKIRELLKRSAGALGEKLPF